MYHRALARPSGSLVVGTLAVLRMWKFEAKFVLTGARVSKAAKRGGFKPGGFPDLDLSFLFCPFLSFLALSRFFRDFPDLLGDGSGIFPIRPFSLSRPIKSTYEEQSRKGPRHNQDLSRKKWETPRFGNTPV